MLNEIQIFLNRHQLNAEQVAKASGLSSRELLHLGKPFDTIDLRIVHALGLPNNYPPEKVIKELISIHGNPVVRFIIEHPWIDRQLVSRVKNLTIKLAAEDINMIDVSFNRYYHDGLDTNERAERYLRRIYQNMLKRKQVIDNYQK